MYHIRVVKSIRGAPAEYGVDDTKLRSLDKILLTLEGKLMDGKILQVHMYILQHTAESLYVCR